MSTGSKNPDLEIPHSWMDLIKEDYRRKVSYRGKDDRSYCEGVLFTLHQMGGEEAIHKLGGSVKSRLHPAEMAKLAGTRREEAPDVSVIPVAFALMAKARPTVEIVYPAGKTSVIIHMIAEYNRLGISVGVIKLDCLMTEDDKLYRERDIPVLTGLSGNLCPDHYFASNVEYCINWGRKQDRGAVCSQNSLMRAPGCQRNCACASKCRRPCAPTVWARRELVRNIIWVMYGGLANEPGAYHP